MCLERKGTFKPCKIGYKVMKLDANGNLVGEWRSRYRHRKLGVWLDESDFRDVDSDTLRTDNSNSVYPIGWHIFNNLVDAKEMGGPDLHTAIVRVSVKEPVAVGYQGTLQLRRVTVAKQIKILRIIN